MFWLGMNREVSIAGVRGAGPGARGPGQGQGQAGVGRGRGCQRSVVSPTERVICFWKATIRITSGSIARVVPAITMVQLL